MKKDIVELPEGHTEELGTVITVAKKLPNAISFMVGGSSHMPLTTILELKENGDIIVQGKLIEDEKEVCEAMREFLFWNANK